MLHRQCDYERGKESGVGYFKLLPQHLSGGTKYNPDNHDSFACRPIFKPQNFQT
jgi:hypothetical protein